MKEFIIDGVKIAPGEKKQMSLDMGRLYDFTEMKIPVEIIRGHEDGCTLFVSAAIHGDEINGIEIVRRLLCHEEMNNIKGTLIAIPIVNVFGFNDRSRYLPDRRDLNRCFPGLENGSLASQLAHKFISEIVAKSDYGIDLHTGSYHRHNYPQIRANIDDFRTLELARAFGAPVIINSNLRDGSLREAASSMKKPVLLYEGGEALRFDEKAINVGIDGILSFMKKVGMIENCNPMPKRKKRPFIANASYWVRAPHGGIHIPECSLGKLVKKGEILGRISNPFGESKTIVRADQDGLIIGTSMLPLANRGDALFHIATKQNCDYCDEIARGYAIDNSDPVNSNQI